MHALKIIAALAVAGMTWLPSQALGVDAGDAVGRDIRLTQLSRFQYYWNAGDWSGAESVPLTPGTDISAALEVSAAGLVPGMNFLHYRIMDSAGKWSVPQHRMCITSSVLPLSLVTALEFFVENDPGVGNATRVDIVNGADVQQAVEVAMGDGPIGFRVFGMRVVNTEGKWSQTHWNLFLRPGYQNMADIESFTWWFSGPATGPETTYDFTGFPPGSEIVWNAGAPETPLQVTQLVQGQSYRLHLYATNTRGQRGQEIVHPFTVNWIPQNVRGTAEDYFTLHWDAIPGATAYQVLAADAPEGFSLLGTTSNLWWPDPDGDKRFFRVKAVRD